MAERFRVSDAYNWPNILSSVSEVISLWIFHDFRIQQIKCPWEVRKLRQTRDGTDGQDYDYSEGAMNE